MPIADADWEEAKLFSQAIATPMAADSPKLYLAKMTKSLRAGRVFIDYFRYSPKRPRSRPIGPARAPARRYPRR